MRCCDFFFSDLALRCRPGSATVLIKIQRAQVLKWSNSTRPMYSVMIPRLPRLHEEKEYQQLSRANTERHRLLVKPGSPGIENPKQQATEFSRCSYPTAIPSGCGQHPVGSMGQMQIAGLWCSSRCRIPRLPLPLQPRCFGITRTDHWTELHCSLVEGHR